jgi:uncharacterized protein YcfL
MSPRLKMYVFHDIVLIFVVTKKQKIHVLYQFFWDFTGMQHELVDSDQPHVVRSR